MVLAGAGLLVGVLNLSDAFLFHGLHGVPNGVAALIFCVGIPIAFITRRYIPQRFP
jgi:hypothetical protein